MTRVPGEYREALLEHAGVPEAQRRSLLGEAIEYVAGVIAGPALTEPYPALTPEDWRDMRCRESGTVDGCWCRFCRWETANRARITDWERASSLRPQPRHPSPFGSVGDAIARTMAWRTDGAALESSTGRQLDRLRDEATSGVKAHVGNRADREPRSAYLAGRAVDVERALVRCCSVEERRRGLPTWTYVRVLVASFVAPAWDAEVEAEGLAVSLSIVRGLVRDGRKAMAIELAAREIVPAPTRPSALVREVEMRRAELAERAVST